MRKPESKEGEEGGHAEGQPRVAGGPSRPCTKKPRLGLLPAPDRLPGSMLL